MNTGHCTCLLSDTFLAIISRFNFWILSRSVDSRSSAVLFIHNMSFVSLSFVYTNVFRCTFLAKSCSRGFVNILKVSNEGSMMVTHRIKSNRNTGFCTISWGFPFPSFDRSPKWLLPVSSSALSIVFSDESLLNDIVGRITKEGSSESPFRSICTKFTRTICLYYRLYINIYNIYKYI